MRQNKFLFPFVVTILFTLACIAVNLPQPTPTAAPTVTRTATPFPTQIATPTLFPVNLKVEPIPSWATDFANPIIAIVANRRPDFHDSFSPKRKWFNVMSGYSLPLYAEIHDGMLFLRLPEGTRDSILYNPIMNRRNFVLTLELRFDHDQPDDTVRFQFDQSPDQSIAFDLSNNRNWKFQWGSRNNRQSVGGIYEHFPPERIPVTIIMQGTQCAVYLNNDPLTYSDNCRTSPTFLSPKWFVSFRLIRNTSHAVTVNFDNLKLWDLDKIPGLP